MALPMWTLRSADLIRQAIRCGLHAGLTILGLKQGLLGFKLFHAISSE